MRSLLFTTLILAGCTDTLEPGSLITGSRVLGARVEVDGDALRSWPAPDETARLTWIVAAPDAAPPMAWAFAACAATLDGLGCAGAPFTTDAGAGAVPTTALAIPGATALGGATAVRVLGVICAGGMPELDGHDPACAGDAPTQTDVALTVPVAVTFEVNHNPTLGVDAIRLDGESWTALDPGAEPPLEGCAARAGGPALPLRHATKTASHVAVALDDADREPVIVMMADGTTAASRETMQVSHFATAGKLARQFSVIEGSDPTTTPAIDVEWTPLDDNAAPPPADGLRVRFTFVTRDGRGGLDAATRVACLVP